MKKIITKIPILTILFATNIVLAQYREPRGRYYSGDENIGLPSLGFTGKSLIVAVILFALGWVISKANEKPNGEGDSSLGGCLLMLGGICAIPGLVWLQTIVASIWIIGIGAIIIIGGIALLWDKIKGK
ncbi:hypothetical protein [Tenacibaculum finnmarkense]|uniref:Uncharacterized protein n=1 Tax=Tenacibaculum finnmarkense genomovar finnmarkense TaxID=1458503 RepID=A0AAP1RH17_9FLAO|nr:hypothetical protein [Tenacibaculum finnmarkense]MBE7695763.1 hypothetical protein [Tenacibaculum finnmarkense genomovar finnmarkense]MCG8751548.1 hypothetical protein [Tenacibaculum finnmarkense]MCG8770595.1 hypothetical protein [Tenacibaculum finnmarkense]MCG8775633.1 hypothetical protein [Tenacibaculum finnmarkense]MCG8872760.1 hypothetical protein [Tenacibaculum finnmarkense]